MRLFMAWCYYCRRYTVNGQCPCCNRIYQFPGKKYDFYGREIKESKPNSTSSSSSFKSGKTYTVHVDGYYKDEGSVMAGFFLALPISFGAIIIASKIEKREMKRGAIIGTIVWGIVIIHVITILLAVYNENLFQENATDIIMNLFNF